MATVTDQKRGTAGASGGDKDDGKQKGGKKTLFMIIIAALLVVAGAGGAYFMLSGGESGPPPTPKPGAMVKMDPMTLSLADHHFLKVQVAIELVQGQATPETFGTVKASQLIIETFSNRDATEIVSNAARSNLKQQLLAALQETYPKKVYNIYLTQFVIQ